MLTILVVPLLIAFGLLIWSGAKFILTIRSKEIVRIRDILLIGVALLVCSAFISAVMAIMAGLGHSVCAMKRADVQGALVFVILAACPIAAMFLYRYYQTLVFRQREEQPKTDTRPDLRKLRIWVTATAAILAVTIIALLGRLSLWPPLMFALRNDFTGMAVFLIDFKLFSNQADLCGYTPLPFAALIGKADMAKRMVEHGADINAPDTDKMTALNWALLKQRTELAAYLVEKGADVNAGLHAPLSQACSTSNWGLARLMVEKGAKTGVISATVSAVKAGNLDMARFLLDHGGDSAIKSKQGEVALMDACREGHSEVVRFLLENGVSPFVKTYSGVTPIIEATRDGHGRVVEILREYGPKASPRHKIDAFERAIDDRDALAAKQLIDAGVDPNGRSLQYQDMPLLTRALFALRPEIAEMLIAHGADVNAKDRYGRTPLMGAAGLGSAELVKQLLEKGADPYARDNSGDNAIHYARRAKSAEVERLLGDREPKLLEKSAEKTDGPPVRVTNEDQGFMQSVLGGRAEINAVDGSGLSALHWACHNGSQEIVKTLIQRGADVNLKSVHDLTPLMSACRPGHVQIAKLLLENGAEINVQSKKGWSPLMWAAEQGNPELVQLLLENGASVDARSTAGITVLKAAKGPQLQKIRDLLTRYGAKE